ncbi:MAG: DNA polymerase III subunit delta' [Actinomycetota bacterium]|nr:DNA polymerase III subunit delta' [Actinomycetota bacterium]
MSVWDLLGDSDPIAHARQRVRAGSTSHAWLLAGPSGAGKMTAALAIAAALNCNEEPNIGCGECSRCLRVMRRRFPDVQHVVPEGPLIPVDLIRETVLPEAARSTFEGRYKVFIIEEADKMNEAAQNALLKTLEEPVPGTVFILITDQLDEVLETIQSRCQVVYLDPIPEATVAESLQREGAAEEVAQVAARIAQGDLGRARALAFEDHVAERRRFWTGIPRRLTSSIDALDLAAEVIDQVAHAVKAREAEQKTEITDLSDAIGEGRGTAAARNALALRHKRELRRVEQEVLGEALETAASFYRDVVAVRSRGADALSNLDMYEEIETWSRSSVADVALLQAVERCLAARSSLVFNANQLLAVEAALLEAARLVPPPARVGVEADS